MTAPLRWAFKPARRTIAVPVTLTVSPLKKAFVSGKSHRFAPISARGSGEVVRRNMFACGLLRSIQQALAAGTQAKDSFGIYNASPVS
jgi:hypothetical protein